MRVDDTSALDYLFVHFPDGTLPPPKPRTNTVTLKPKRKPQKSKKAKTTANAAKERRKMTPSMRFEVLRRAGFRCEACGADPKKDRGVRLQVDHIIPVSKGGKSEYANLQCLCRDCNRGKGAKIVPEMKRKPDDRP